MSVIGVDVGTSRIKAVRFDEAWHEADVEAEATVVDRPAPGRSEQDMDAVWRATVRVLRAVIGRSPDPITLIAVTAQGDGCWLVDHDGEPVGPALLWNDARAGDQVTAWQRDGTAKRAFAINGCYHFAGLASAQLRWLETHAPATLARADTLLSAGGWIHSRLTGERVVDETDAANPFFDARRRRYGPDLPDLYGLGSWRQLLPPAVRGTDRISPMLDEVARTLGLSEPVPAAAAPYDVVSTAIGSGTHDVGDAFAILGTTLCVGMVDDDPRMGRPHGGMSLPGPRTGTWLMTYPTMSGTGVLDWAADLLGVGDAEHVIALAATADRSHTPLVLPYFSAAGERSPFIDLSARGAITGLDVSHGRADIAAGIVDSLSLVVRDCLSPLGEATSLALSGGGARSVEWCQTICDAVGIPVTMPDASEVGARGAAIVGLTDLRRGGLLEEEVNAAVRPGRSLEPDPVNAARLDLRYGELLDARERLLG